MDGRLRMIKLCLLVIAKDMLKITLQNRAEASIERNKRKNAEESACQLNLAEKLSPISKKKKKTGKKPSTQVVEMSEEESIDEDDVDQEDSETDAEENAEEEEEDIDVVIDAFQSVTMAETNENRWKKNLR